MLLGLQEKIYKEKTSSLPFSFSHIVQKHWKSMDHLRGLDKHNTNFSLKARRFTVCSWKHASFIQVFITLERLGYLPSYRTKLQCLKQVSRTPCLLWSSSIMCDGLHICTEIHKNQFCLTEWVLTAVFEIPNLLWRLVSDCCKLLSTCQCVDDAKHVGLRTLIFFFCISLNPGNNLHTHNTEFQHIHAPY